MEKNSKYTILVVDDVTENIKILTNLLKSEYSVIFAKDGETALDITRAKKPDLILLDIIMPGIDGYEVCKRIKKDETTRHIPIIFVTAVSEAIDEAKAFESGGVDYITKPFNPITVKARISTHIELNTTIQNLEAALKKVKKLSGLLPICAKCKKIRDDKGYWNQVESYLEANSEILFSHAMCPDCLEQAYGEKEWFKKMKRNQTENKEQ